MNILISNDDGIFAPGILAAKQTVEDIANVVVVAPDKNNSSVGCRLTLFKHLKINSCKLDDGSLAYSVSGSPADCVIVGVVFLEPKIDRNRTTHIGENGFIDVYLDQRGSLIL